MSRAPVASLLASCLSGLPTIRAFGSTQHFEAKFDAIVYANGRAFITLQYMSRALGFYLDILASIIIIASMFLAFAIRNDDNPLILGLALQQLASLLGFFQFIMRLSADL